MYMFVLVTLIVAVMGIYMQVFNVQSSHMSAQQNGIAQAMLDWHSAAVGLAQGNVTSIAVTTKGACSLTQGWSPTLSPSCYKTGPIIETLPGAGGLPQGYQSPPFAFYSVVFQLPATSQSYVLTFVPPPAGNPAFVCLPSVVGGVTACTQIDIVMNDLLTQIKRRGG